MITLTPDLSAARYVHSYKKPVRKNYFASAKKLLQAFRRAANQSQPYRVLLDESRLNSKSIMTARDFVQLCPILEKSIPFSAFLSIR